MKKTDWRLIGFYLFPVYCVIRILFYITGWDGHGKVYICTGRFSDAYHTYKSCDGLSKCSGAIKSVSIKMAKDSLHRKECRYCRNGEQEAWGDEFEWH